MGLSILGRGAGDGGGLSEAQVQALINRAILDSQAFETVETVKIARQGTAAEMNPIDFSASAAIVSVNHGLGAVPDIVDCYMECITADKAYAVGDIVKDVHVPWRITVQVDATQLHIIPNRAGNEFGLVAKNDGRSTADFDEDDWKYVVVPYLLEDKSVIVRAAPEPLTTYFGTSADDTPTGAELTIEGMNGRGTIAAYAGSMHLLIARLATESDISLVRFSDDDQNFNQVGAFTKHANTVVPTGETEAFNVWVSNQSLTQTDDLTITVR